MSEWPAAEELSIVDLRRYEAMAYEWFCSCPKQQRRIAWSQVMTYKTELDRQKPRSPSEIPMPQQHRIVDETTTTLPSYWSAEDR